MHDKERDPKEQMERFEDLGRKLFQVPKEQIETDDDAEGPSEEPTEDEEPDEADS